MTHNFISNTAASISNSIVNNVFANLSFSTTGSVVFITNSIAQAANSNMMVSGNMIVGTFNKQSAGGTVTLYSSSASSNASAILNHINNNFSNIILTGATTMAGWSCTGGAGCFKNISANTFTNWVAGSSAVTVMNIGGCGNNASVSNNTLSNIGSTTGAITGISMAANNTSNLVNVSSNIITTFTNAAAITGINVLAATTQTLNVITNSINSFSSTGASVVSGIVSTAQQPHIQRNRIFNLQGSNASSTVNGILLSGGVNSRTYNNIIGDLRTPAATGVNAVNGINISAGTGTIYHIAFNTVYLTGTSSAATFGSSALNASTTPTLNMISNILINNTTPKGTAVATAFRRSSTTLASYSLSSNGNLFYAGVPSATKVIFYDGTTAYQTLTSFKTLVSPRDLYSVTENTSFLSTTGSNPLFLHIDNNIPTLTESGGIAVPGINNDIDNEIRSGSAGYPNTGAAPDIGADENEPILPPCSSANGGTLSAVNSYTCSGLTMLIRSNGFSAGTSSTYQWMMSTSPGGPYTNVSGGFGANATGYTPPATSTGTFYYVMMATCSLVPASSLSTEYTLVVHPMPTSSISVASNTVCTGQPFNLTASTDIGTNFSWTGPNGFTSSLQSPTILSPTLNAAGVYSVIVSTPNCTAVVSTLTTTAFITPSQVTVSPVTATMCQNTQQTLAVLGGFLPGTLTVGPNSSVNTSSTYPAPYHMYYGGQRMQMLVLASELSAAGFGIGSELYNVQFGVSSLGSNWPATTPHCQNFIVNMGLTSLTSLTSFQTGLSTVVAATNFTPVTGSNVHTFGSPFIWDGVSNLIIETAFSNSITGTVNDAVIQYTTATSYVSTIVSYLDLASAATMYTTTVVSESILGRPDFRINGLVIAPYTWAPSTGLSATTGYSVSASPLANTVYTVRSTNNSCFTSATTTITVNPSPTINIAQTSPSVCAASPLTLTANGATSYTWTGGPATDTRVVSPVSSSVYTVTGINSFSCVSTQTAGVTVYQYPVLVFSPSSPSVCVSVQNTVSASGAATYTWNGTPGTSQYVFATATNTTFTVSASSSQGCVTSATLGITTNSLPVITISPSSATVCSQSPVQFTASGSDFYNWSNFVNTSTMIVSPSGNTVFTVVGSNTTGCSSTATVAVTTLSLPVISITPSLITVCPLSTNVYTASGAVTYTWSNSVNTATASITTTNSSLYSVTGTNPEGCEASAALTVLTYSLPVITVLPQQPTVCANSPSNFTATGASTYTWSTGPSGTTVALTPTANTIYSISGTSSLTGCTGTNTFAVNTLSSPVMSILPNTTATVCLNGTASFTSSGANTYTWSNNMYGPVMVVTASTAAVYTVTGKNSQNCTASKTVAVNLFPVTDLTISTASPTLCLHEKLTLTGTGATSYTWLPTNFVGSVLTTTAVASMKFILTGTDANGCYCEDSLWVSVSKCTGLQKENESNSVSVYPNPGTGLFMLNFGTEGEKQISIMDARGALIMDFSTSETIKELDLSQNARGVYLMSVSSGGTLSRFKIVLQ